MPDATARSRAASSVAACRSKPSSGSMIPKRPSTAATSRPAARAAGPGPLEGRLAEADAPPPPGRAHHLRHDGKPADRAAAAVDGVPAFPHADPAEGRPGHLPGGFGHAQQPPQILVAAIED